MTLEELQAEFPHGSRWRHHNGAVLRVVGHRIDDGWPVFEVLRNGEERSYHYDSYSGMRFPRIPDPVPCPITEPVTLHYRRDCGEGYPDYWDSSPALLRDYRVPDVPAITLHPADLDATEGRYTWEESR